MTSTTSNNKKLVYISIATLVIALALGIGLWRKKGTETPTALWESQSPGTVAALQSQTRVIFDTRTQNEFDSGHLEGAILVDPDMPADEFLARYGEKISGKTTVFYCAAGGRSSRFLKRLTSQQRSVPASGLINMEGGIRAWQDHGLRISR